ncbi:MAG: cadherin repeat domain-containing protein, partial [Candidatus Zixiibacteriota bacterium]
MSNQTFTIAEDATEGDLGTVVATDDAGQTITYAITAGNVDLGGGNNLFAIDAATGALTVTDPTALDFETTSSYALTVTATDSSPNLLSSSAIVTVEVTDANDAPTLALENPVTELAENLNPTSAVKVADIVVGDDALGEATVTLSGDDADLFEIVGTELFLKAGTVLDFETQSALNVTVAVDDPTVGATPDDAVDLTIAIADVNEAPSVTVSNVVTELAENLDTTTAVKVADITVTDDALGTNVLGVAGPDADLFEVVGNELFLKAGSTLNFETATQQLNVTVTVDDAAVGETPDDAVEVAIAITDVNEAPSLDLTQVVDTLAENLDTTTAVKVADLTVTDDALGTNALTLSGP